MNFTIFLVSLYIFLDNIGYSIYEFKNNNNKLAGICIIILNLIMIGIVNYFIYIY